MESSAKNSTIPIKRACDACHRRKVRCTGGQPCRNCGQSSLNCTYDAVPQKKGPKGSRAKVITELRETQRRPESTSLKALHSPLAASFDPVALGPIRNPTLLTRERIDECVEFFFANMYPTMPILSRERFLPKIAEMDTNTESYCLVASMCAFMLIQSGASWGAVPGDMKINKTQPTPVVNAGTILGTAVLEEVLRTRKQHDFVDSPSVSSVITAFFLFGCYFGLDKHNTAWFYLREATTLAQIMGLQHESTYLLYDAVDATRMRRLFWLLFVTER